MGNDDVKKIEKKKEPWFVKLLKDEEEKEQMQLNKDYIEWFAKYIRYVKDLDHSDKIISKEDKTNIDKIALLYEVIVDYIHCKNIAETPIPGYKYTVKYKDTIFNIGISDGTLVYSLLCNSDVSDELIIDYEDIINYKTSNQSNNKVLGLIHKP